MSSIDQRIVQMLFDNKQFETNAQTTLGTMDKLNKGMNLDGASKGLENLDKASKSFSLAGIASGIDSISGKFSAFGIAGITALQNITNAAINTGKQLVKSLTVDPIMDGMANYETKINSIQTILANTSSQGTKLSDVTKALDELNTYANQTVYNFSDMTKNIGTFTAAGVGLKTSVSSIKGIANLAAMSGSSSQQASTAMYQLSQAIAAGSVKVQDWNSVVNAGMGGTQFQEALKRTARAHGVAVDDMIKKDGSFRESLKSGWVTAQILTDTLNQYTGDLSASQLKQMGYTEKDITTILKMGKTANDSATKIRTVTQLTQALKEEVGTAWGAIWEDVFGNIDQATATLSSAHNTLENMLTGNLYQVDALLKAWDKLGGRTKLIDAVKNAFEALMAVIKPIKDAFAEIFPRPTAQQLYNMTAALDKFTASLKIGSGTAGNVKRTFAGLFAIFDLAKQIFLAIGKAVGDFIKTLAPAGRGILSFTGNIGDWLVALDKAAKKSDVFKKAIQKIEDVLAPVVKGIQNGVANIKKAFESLGSADLKVVDGFTGRVKKRFDPLGKIFGKLEALIKKVAPIAFSFASMIARVFGELQKKVVDFLDHADFSSILDVINGLVGVSTILSLKGFISGIKKVTTSASGFLDSFKSIFTSVHDILQSYQKDLQAKTLMKIAAAVALLAASLFVLSLIDSKKMTVGLAGLSAIMVELFGSAGVFSKMLASKDFKSFGRVTTSMIKLSVAVLILAVAMKKLADLSWEQVAKGLTSVAALMGILVSASALLSKFGGKSIKGAASFAIFAAAILVLVSAVKKLGALDVPTLIKGLTSVAALMTELALFTKMANLNKMGINKGAGLLLLATSILILETAVSKLGKMDIATLVKGLVSLEAVFSELALFTKMTNNAKGVISTAVGMTILGAAMLIFAKAISNMAALSWEQIAKGMTTMAGALTAITVATNLMPKDMMSKGAAMVLFATSMVILSKALSSMGGMSWEQIAKGLVTLAGALGIIDAALALMTNALPGAAALMVIAVAVDLLTPALQALGSLSLSEIGLALLALAGAFAVLGGAAAILTPVLPAMMGLAGAVTLFSVAALAAGVGMLAFSAGLAILSAAGAGAAVAITAILSAVAGVIPLIIEKLGEGIIAFAGVIANGGPALLSAFTTILESLIQAVTTVIPDVVKAILTLLTAILTQLANYIPKMVDAGMKLLLGLLKGIADNIQQVVEEAVTVVVNFVEGIANSLPKIIQAATDLILAFINGLADAIRNNHNKLYDAVGNLISAIVEAVGDLMWKLVDVGKNIVDGIIEGIGSMLQNLVDAALGVVHTAVDAVKNFLGIHSPSRVFREIGRYSGKGLILGIQDMSVGVREATKGLGKDAVSSMRNTIGRVYDSINTNMDMVPTITPVIDLSNVKKGSSLIGGMLNSQTGLNVNATAARASLASGSMNQNGSDYQPTGTDGRVVNMNFQQNITSPKAVSRLDIYRDTKSQFSRAKGALEAI